MSEMLMFQEKKDSSGKTYQSRYSHSIISYGIELYSPKVLNEYAEERYPTSNDNRYDYRNATTLMTNAIFMSDKTDRIAFSVGLGTNIGLDATAKLFDKTYLTTAIDILNSQQGQVILQNRIFDGNPIGLSLGLSYQRNHQYVQIDGVRCGLCFPSEEFFTHSIGLRSVGLISAPSYDGSPALFIYVMGSVNYDVTMDTIYPKIGFSLGLY
jgi:hypothetical protein